MADTTMPAAEAAPALAQDDERSSYELAFHVLPTVAEGEVSGVFEALKALISKDGGESFAEEAPERVDLAYDITEHLEGKNRKFHSAYFGWVRFRIAGEALSKLTEEIEARTDILRYLIIKLTKAEEAHPFYYHEAQKTKKVVTVHEDEAAAAKDEVKVKTEYEAPAEVKEKELDESLEKITTDEDKEAEKKE